MVIKDSGQQRSIFEGEIPLKITKPLRLIELFAGIGAQAKALENLGVSFEHYRICEFDKHAVASYNAVHGTEFITSDITKIHADDLGVVETDKYEYIMTYSFPCTDLSSVGKRSGMRRGSGTRSGLLWEVERLLKEMQELPQLLLMENVPDILLEKNINDFLSWCEVLNTLGYTSKYSILNAKDFGVPQNRKRCFMLSWLKKECYYEFPESCLMRPFVDYLDFDCDYVIKPENLTKTQQVCITHLANETFSKTVRVGGLKSRDRHAWNVYSVELRQSENFIKKKSLCLKNLSKTICAQHLISYTIDGKVYFDYSPRECWKLMGFSDDDFLKAQKVCTKTQFYKQAGNSIVVDVLMAIFKKLL